MHNTCNCRDYPEQCASDHCCDTDATPPALVSAAALSVAAESHTHVLHCWEGGINLNLDLGS